MGRSFYSASTANTIGDGKKAITFHHKASDSYFTMFERGGKFYQGRHQTGFDGKETNLAEKQIDYVIGSGNHARTYLHRTVRNTLEELPLGWYAEKGGSWGMNPGYDRPDHPDSTRNVTHGCMFCHNGIPEIPVGNSESGAEPVFSGHLPEGIDCQRCHGPGSKHVHIAQTAGAKRDDIRKAIVNPARLTSERQLEVCMQCHLETTSSQLPNAIVRYERSPFSYRPGEPLGDFMLHFDQAPATGGEDRFQIVNAAYRLRQSACFRKSDAAPRCTTCHDPHGTPRAEEAAQHYTQVCRECHNAPFDKLVASGKHPQSSACVDCHMPKRRTDDVVHVVMTDHYIQRVKPARDLLSPIEERRETDSNAYRGEVVLYYPPELPKGQVRDLYTAIAQVSQKSNLSKGVGQLAGAIEKYRPESIDYYLQLADAWTDTGQPAKALPLQEEAVRREPNSLIALRKLAITLRTSGQLTRSVEVLKHALAVSPADAATWHQLGLDYLAQGSKPDAIAAFEKAVNLDPDMSEAWNSLGGVRLEGGELPRAESAFREAIRVQPSYAEAHSNLGNALSSRGSFPEARFHFEAAIRYKPDYFAARFNYALALARVNRFEEAQHQIEAALKSDPGSAEAHDLLGNLLMAKGKLPLALDQYREALRIRPQFARASLDIGEALADSGDLAGALPYLQQAAQSPQPDVREQALQALQQFQKR
jgi:predicted CXXCH cytochrome family protein